MSSTMKVARTCTTCGKWLKETEVHFYNNTCTECHDREVQAYINAKDSPESSLFLLLESN